MIEARRARKQSQIGSEFVSNAKAVKVSNLIYGKKNGTLLDI
jgi:hypothetical protein